jgi:hypothetical protein
MQKILILYVFHKLNNNLLFFLKNGIINSDHIKYIFICNNLNIKLNNLLSNFTVIRRDNIGYDFGAWSDALLTNNLYKNYEYFLFINSSALGPFIKDNKLLWPYIFVNELKKNIKLVGPTINASYKWDNYNHVQSYCFCMCKSTLEYLIKCKIFSIENYPKTKREAEKQYEIVMSRLIIKNKWNIGSLHNYYKDDDFLNLNKDKKLLGDVMFNKYNNILWNKYELVFIKGNRVRVKLE